MCSAMGIYGGLFTTVFVGGVVLYSTGPSQVIGAGGVIVYGTLAVTDKVQAYVKSLDALYHDTSHDQTPLVKQKVANLDSEVTQHNHDYQQHMRMVKIFLGGMVPFVGGFISIAIAEKKT